VSSVMQGLMIRLQVAHPWKGSTSPLTMREGQLRVTQRGWWPPFLYSWQEPSMDCTSASSSGVLGMHGFFARHRFRLSSPARTGQRFCLPRDSWYYEHRRGYAVPTT